MWNVGVWQLGAANLSDVGLKDMRTLGAHLSAGCGCGFCRGAEIVSVPESIVR